MLDLCVWIQVFLGPFSVITDCGHKEWCGMHVLCLYAIVKWLGKQNINEVPMLVG